VRGARVRVFDIKVGSFRGQQSSPSASRKFKFKFCPE
jgi:hypothetical protein